MKRMLLLCVYLSLVHVTGDEALHEALSKLVNIFILATSTALLVYWSSAVMVLMKRVRHEPPPDWNTPSNGKGKGEPEPESGPEPIMASM